MEDEKVEEKLYVNQYRLLEFWTAILSALALKADVSVVSELPTVDAVATAIATAIGPYAKTEDVIRAIESALENYMTSEEVSKAITDAIGDSMSIRIEVVDDFPEDPETRVIYFLPSSSPSEKNTMEEWMYVNGNWEKIGSTKIDLSGYWAKDELRPMTSEELQEILS